MTILFTIVHIIVCLFLVIVVLLQSGKAADLAGAFGGMGSQTAFGPRGSATDLSKATTIAAALFMITSMSLAIVATRTAGTSSTVLEREANKLPKPAPAQAPAQAPGGQPSVTLVAGQVADRAGNTDLSATQTFTIDLSAPTGVLIAPALALRYD